MEDLVLSFITKDFLILVAVLYVLGMFFKAWPAIADWTIPFILLILGIGLAIVYNGIALAQGFGPAAWLFGLTQGILCAAVAVFFNQLIKQGTTRE
jgi:hypothetical protein